MNEKQFLKTMIETIKYDEDIQNKDDLLGILRYSIVTFRKTGAYTHVSNQRQEYMDLRVPIPMLKKQRNIKMFF
ncbi:Phosphatidylserine/phosphatidylglycerophosphate/cardiolipin synthase-like protein [human gut metagenome]|uniref:Phosphatidylserine/phosphatidylglycerophosphate/ cardiolipin synthase-like protein n=2 Tax=root TaxID=1 RepID=K1UFN2_9ZZZZ